MRTNRLYNKIQLKNDPKYDSPLIAKFISLVMQRGKRSVASKIVYYSLEELAKKTKKSPLDSLEQVVNNVGPILEVRGRRIGGANYQIPVEVSHHRRVNLALRWVIAAAKKSKGKKMAEKLTQELTDAYNNQGEAIKKRTDVMKMAEANRAFAHFARM
jgi:small subunit ribosomal protein S7